MALFPGALPSFAGFTASHTLAADNHAAQHNLEQGEVTAIATKVGTGASTPVASTVLRGTGTGTSAFAKVDLTTDVTGTLPLANGGLGVTTLADFKTTFLALAYPVGSIYTNAVDATNPGSLLGFGTWVAFGQGRVIVGLNGADTDFDSASETGGEKTHTLTATEMPSHTHIQDAHTHNVPARDTDDAGTTAAIRGTDAGVTFPTTSTIATNQNTGGDGAHNNVQPYIVCYLWRRTA